MKSPFPGMDPYLERHWGDVHASLVVYASRQMNARLPHDLCARVHECFAVTDSSITAERVHRHVRIVDASDHDHVVTVIEVLSPWIKVSEAARRAYGHQQRQSLAAGANLVEID